jgi:hypothetical protein
MEAGCGMIGSHSAEWKWADEVPEEDRGSCQGNAALKEGECPECDPRNPEFYASQIKWLRHNRWETCTYHIQAKCGSYDKCDDCPYVDMHGNVLIETEIPWIDNRANEP